MDYIQKYDKLTCILRRKYSSSDEYVLKDTLSEAFKRIIIRKNIKDMDELEGHEQYLLTIAQNILIDNFQRHLNYEVVEEYSSKKETDNFYTKNCLEMLLICCDEIKLKYLEIIVWTEIEGFTYEELSKLFNISKPALRKRKSRAIESMREFFRKKFKNDVTNLDLKGI